jgi:hypothetical protein
VSKPFVSIRFSLEMEVDYDPFKGRTPEEFAEIIHDDLHLALENFREEDVQGIFSSVESVEKIGL